MDELSKSLPVGASDRAMRVPDAHPLAILRAADARTPGGIGFPIRVRIQSIA